jgi:hypothetical protein
MVGKDIYINCGTVGLTEWPDGEVDRATRGPAIPNGQAGQTDTRTGAQRRVDRRLTEGVRVPDEEREWPMEGSMCARRKVAQHGTI